MRVIRKRKTSGRLALTALALLALMGLTAAQSMGQESANTFSREVPEQKITFSTVNPYTKAPGSMTIVLSGVFHVTRVTEGPHSGGARVTGNQTGSFSFVPDDPSQPKVNGKFRFWLAGQTQPRSNALQFAFRMDGVTPDGSAFTFVQTERVALGEDAADISFGETRAVEGNH